MAKVLVLDDNELIAGLLETVLRDAGHLVVLALGLDAVPADVAPDVIVTDLLSLTLYRTEDARAWIDTLRARFPGTPVLVCTGHPAAIPEREAIGASAVIGKPFDVDDLLATVERLTA